MQYYKDSASKPPINLTLGKNKEDEALCPELTLWLWTSHLGLHIKWDLTSQLSTLLKCTTNWNDRVTGVLWVARCACKYFEMPSCKVQRCQSSSAFKRKRSWRRKNNFIFFFINNYYCKDLSAHSVHSGLSQDENLRLQLSISMSNSSGTEVLAPE